MKILLTGVTGFIGGALATRLAAGGHEVHALVREHSDTSAVAASVNVHRYDGSTVRLCELMSELSPEVVLHLASLFLADHTIEQVSDLARSNVEFGMQLLEAMRRSGVTRLVNTGTCWQHFDSAEVRPVNLYAATKQAFDAIIRYYHDAYGLSQLTLKLCDTYGPRDPRRKLISILLKAASSGELLDMSPGDQMLDLSEVDDVILAFEQAIKLLCNAAKPLNAAYAVSGSRHTLKEVVTIVGEVTGRTLHVSFGGRPYRPREVMNPQTPDPILPGWHPAHDLRSGLRRLLAFQNAADA